MERWPLRRRVPLEAERQVAVPPRLRRRLDLPNVHIAPAQPLLLQGAAAVLARCGANTLLVLLPVLVLVLVVVLVVVLVLALVLAFVLLVVLVLMLVLLLLVLGALTGLPVTSAPGLGMNFVRHHSHILPIEYFNAACEVGIMISAEFP